MQPGLGRTQNKAVPFCILRSSANNACSEKDNMDKDYSVIELGERKDYSVIELGE